MSSTISPLQLAANDLNYAAMIFLRSYCYIAIPLGTIGHLMSIYVFTRPSLRSNSCARYFLAATIVGLLTTCYALPMRTLQAGFVNTDPGAYSIIFCKITWFLLNSTRGMSFWFIVLACGDRYLCSSASTAKRAWSSVHVTNRAILITVLICCIAYVHVPVFFKIDIVATTQQPICYGRGPPGTYRLILSYINLMFLGLSPSLSMLIFGLLTLRNIERSKRLVIVPSATGSSSVENAVIRNHRKHNTHLLQMLFIQVFVYFITSFTYSVVSIYAAVVVDRPKSVYQVAQENLMNVIVGIFSTVGPCFSCYLFTLSSSLFRKELKNLFYICRPIGN